MTPRTEKPVKPHRPSTVVDEICRQLRRRILHGKLLPGTRLVELDIAGRAGISQASVRDALQRLERDGLVERRGRDGTFVTPVSPEKMKEIFQIRRMVEGFAVRRLVRSIRPDQIEELKNLVECMREAGRTGDTVALVEYDMAFHQRICAWADHPMLLRMWILLHSQMERFLVMFDALHFADLRQVADNHMPIITAIAERNADLAASRIEEHVMIGATAKLPGDHVKTTAKSS